MIPSAAVAWAYSGMGIVAIAGAFTWPLAYPIVVMGGSVATGLVLSSTVQLVAFILLSRSKLPAKRKITFAILWGMGFALAVRIILAYELKLAVMKSLLEQ